MKFACLEGMDGSGKSTVARELTRSFGATVISNPGSTPLALHLRELLLHRTDIEIPSIEAAFLFTAGTINTLRKCRHLADRGSRVILDRGFGSTLAYQNADGCPLETLHALGESIPRELSPDVTFFLSVSEDTRVKRLLSTGDRGRDRFESKGKEYFTQVAKNYKEVGGMCYVDAEQSVEMIAQQIATHLGWN